MICYIKDDIIYGARTYIISEKETCIQFNINSYENFLKEDDIMRMGVRDVANLVFKPLTSVDIGNQHFDAGQPVLYIDTAKTSNIEGAATTVYATGGRGNPRLIG